MTHEYGMVIDSLRQRLLDRRRAIVGRVARTDDVLGELEVLIGRGADETLTAVEPTTLATLDRAGVDALLADFPAIAPKFR